MLILRVDGKSEIEKYTVFALNQVMTTLEFTLSYPELEMLKGCFSVPVRALFLLNLKSRQWLHLRFMVVPENKWIIKFTLIGTNIYK